MLSAFIALYSSSSLHQLIFNASSVHIFLRQGSSCQAYGTPASVALQVRNNWLDEPCVIFTYEKNHNAEKRFLKHINTCSTGWFNNPNSDALSKRALAE